MSRLSEDDFRRLALVEARNAGIKEPSTVKLFLLAKALFNAGHKAGQEAMLERVFQIDDCEAIRSLEIEEPK